MKKLILFDIDGTLIGTGGVAMRTLYRALEELHGPRPEGVALHPDGKTDPMIVRELLAGMFPGREFSMDECYAVVSRYVELLPKSLTDEPGYEILPGVQALIERLRDHPDAVQGLGTGNVEAGGRVKLERGGISDFFPFGGFACDHPIRGELIKIGIEKGRKHAGEDVPLEHVFIVGDTPHDISAARFAGARAIAVATGRHDAADLASHEPDLVMENLEDLDGFLAFVGL